MSLDPSSPPNPANSPLEKLLVQRQQLWTPDAMSRYLEQEGLDANLAGSIGRAFGRLEQESNFQFQQVLAELQTWANVHTHPGVAGSTSYPYAPEDFVVLTSKTGATERRTGDTGALLGSNTTSSYSNRGVLIDGNSDKREFAQVQLVSGTLEVRIRPFDGDTDTVLYSVAATDLYSVYHAGDVVYVSLLDGSKVIRAIRRSDGAVMWTSGALPLPAYRIRPLDADRLIVNGISASTSTGTITQYYYAINKATGAEALLFSTACNSGFGDFVLTSDGATVLTVEDRQSMVEASTVLIGYDIAAGAESTKQNITSDRAKWSRMVRSADDTLLVVGSTGTAGRTVSAFRVADGTAAWTSSALSSSTADVEAIAPSPDGSALYVTNGDTLASFMVADGAEKLRTTITSGTWNQCGVLYATI